MHPLGMAWLTMQRGRQRYRQKYTFPSQKKVDSKKELQKELEIKHMGEVVSLTIYPYFLFFLAMYNIYNIKK